LNLDGKTPTLVNTEKGVRAPDISAEYGTPEPSYHYMRRIHWSGKLRYAWIDIHLSQRIYDLDPFGFDSKMIIANLASLDQIKIGKLFQWISFTTADAETAEILEVPINSAIGHVRRVLCDDQQRVIYVGDTRYRGDFVDLNINLQEPPK
jgi:GntR family transcriptional regulator